MKGQGDGDVMIAKRKLRRLLYAWILAEVLIVISLGFWAGWLLPVGLWLGGVFIGAGLLMFRTPLRLAAGVLLFMPGLISSFLGLGLLVRPIRLGLMRSANWSVSKSKNGSLDLDPKDWKRDDL
jgi:UPF0716 family protein affecting phage T7 exclusion